MNTHENSGSRCPDPDNEPIESTMPNRIFDMHGMIPGTNVRMSYDPADPYAINQVISGVISGRRKEATWTYERDLLVTGQFRPTGDDMVRVWPAQNAQGEDVVYTRLTSQEGEILIEIPEADLRPFITCVLETVPPGTESSRINIDGVIAAIIDSAS